MTRRTKQLELKLPTWGGKRRGAGRKSLKDRTGVSHRARPRLASRFPVHISLKMSPDIGNLRKGRRIAPVESALAKIRQGHDRFRVVHYSVQCNHIHLICEAKDQTNLSRGIQGLSIRIARGLNRHVGRQGKVFADRYFSRILKTAREVRNVLAYVLHNARSHARRKKLPFTIDRMEPFSSAPEFDGWSRRPAARWHRTGPPPVAEPRTWLLCKGWRKWGLLNP